MNLRDLSLGHRNLVQYIAEIYSVGSLIILLQRALALFTSAGSDPADQAAHTPSVMGSAEPQGWYKETLRVTAINSLLMYPGWSSVVSYRQRPHMGSTHNKFRSSWVII